MFDSKGSSRVAKSNSSNGMSCSTASHRMNGLDTAVQCTLAKGEFGATTREEMVHRFQYLRYLISRLRDSPMNLLIPIALTLATLILGEERCGSYPKSALCLRPYEVWLRPYFGKNQGTIIDVGANVGQHTRYFSRLGRTVIAVEPSPRAFLILRRRMSKAMNVACMKLALSDDCRRATLFSPRGTLSSNLSSEWGHAASKTVADVLTLDELVHRLQVHDVTLIKVDVDGFEGRVIRGSIGTMKTQKPVLVVEYNSEQLLRELKELCAQADFACKVISPPKHYPVKSGYGWVYCFPKPQGPGRP